jgi:hypothetical protein
MITDILFGKIRSFERAEWLRKKDYEVNCAKEYRSFFWSVLSNKSCELPHGSSLDLVKYARSKGWKPGATIE